MPVTRTATRALRKATKRTEANRPVKSRAASLVKKALVNPTVEIMAEAFSAIDKAVRNNLYHKNKGSRLKSRISKAAISTASK